MSLDASRSHILSKKACLITALLIFFSATTSFGYLRYSQPVGTPTMQHTFTLADETASPDIVWPQAAASIGTVEEGVLVSKPDQTPLPTASAAKLITVLTVLKEKPLAPGEQGPLLTMDQSDISLYNQYLAVNGSLVAVRLGEQLSQYQMLQGILIRSGNNLADGLAIWAFGSMGEYQKAAQQLVDELGMTHTTIGPDASGLSPLTTSTAEDLTKLGIAAMKNEVVREIVRQTSSSFPADGTKPNTNWSLGQNGVIGIKTGNLPSVGGVFIIAVEYAPEGEDLITLVATVQGAYSTYDAILEANQLIDSVKPLFGHKIVVSGGTTVATITTPWGESTNIIATESLTTFGWPYTKAEMPDIQIDYQVPLQKGARVGTISIGKKSVNLITADAIHEPSLKWRLTTSR